jgi:glutamine synthetase
MKRVKVIELYDMLDYTIQVNEIHAWKLNIKDSRSCYYSMDYENYGEFLDDIIKHLLQYGINHVVLIHENINDESEYYLIDSIFLTEEDEFNGEEYFTLHQITKEDANT